MANKPKRTQTVEQLQRNIDLLRSALNELEQVRDRMKENRIVDAEVEHVGQMDRATGYAISYALSFRKAVLSKQHGLLD